MTDTGGTRGRIVSGRYRLVAVLGRGGMGTVWRAVDELLHRDVAVKELRLPDHLDDEERELQRERTMREARTAARVTHENVIVIHDVVEDGGIPWIVMELVEAEALDEILKTRGTLPPHEAAAMGLKVLDALCAAEEKDVLHRDVKPSNILVTTRGRVVLTDFGIATVVGSATLTPTGMLSGTPDFLAPERAEGHAPGMAADLWSLALVLYMAVDGRNPFHRQGMISTLNAIMLETYDPPRHAGPLGPVIEGWLQKDPQARMGTAEARAILSRIAQGTQVVAPADTELSARAAQEAQAVSYYAAEAPYDTPPPQHAGGGQDSEGQGHPSVRTPQTPYPPAQSYAPPGYPIGPPPGTGGHTVAAPPRPNRKPLVFAAVGLVLAIIAAGVAVGLALKDKDKDKANNPITPTSGQGTPSTQPSNTASSGPTPSKTGGQGVVPPPATGDPKESGFTWKRDPAGFSLLVPNDAVRTVKGNQVDYTSRGGKVLIRIDSTKSGKAPLANATSINGSLKTQLPAYVNRQLENYPGYRQGWQAAVLEFQWTGNPFDSTSTDKRPSHAMDLLVKSPSGKEYAIYVASFEADWKAAYDAYSIVARDFRDT